MPIVSLPGFRMYYEVAGLGTPFLFVHGGLGGGRGSATFRHHHMAALSPYSTVVAFDRRAAGQSETPATGYSFDIFSHDIMALLDYLELPRAVFMGTSAGGPQVLHCALHYPERVHALVLGSTATQTVNVPPELAPLITFLGTEGFNQLQTMFTPSTTAAGTSEAGTLDALGGILQTYLAYHLYGDPLAARLAEITVPALILHGTADAEVPFAEAQKLHAGLTSSSLMPFLEGGHGIMVTHAAPYRQAILHFLQELGLARASDT